MSNTISPFLLGALCLLAIAGLGYLACKLGTLSLHHWQTAQTDRLTVAVLLVIGTCVAFGVGLGYLSTTPLLRPYIAMAVVLAMLLGFLSPLLRPLTGNRVTRPSRLPVPTSPAGAPVVQVPSRAQSWTRTVQPAVIGEPQGQHGNLAKTNIPKPAEIKAMIDEHVVGQTGAKVQLAVAAFNHFCRINMQASHAEVEIEKSNVLLLGPSGCGKTHLAQVLAQCLNVPFATADATTLSETGYVGQDVESILSPLIAAADGDVTAAEFGIVYLDEFDKLARRSGDLSVQGRDVSGEGVQRGLLKLLEGTIARVPSSIKRGINDPSVELDTKNILFIVGGAFGGLEQIVQTREKPRSSIGFRNAGPSVQAEAQALDYVEDDDLIKFGLLPEIVGRLPVRAALRGLSVQELKRILVEPKNALVKQQEALMKPDIEVVFTEEALLAIAEEASRGKTGARALRRIVEEIVLPISYHRESGRTEITAEMVRNRRGAEWLQKTIASENT